MGYHHEEMSGQVENLIREAISNIKEGRIEDALLVLERTVDPKFGSVEHATGAHLMFTPHGKMGGVGDAFAEALGHQVAA